MDKIYTENQNSAGSKGKVLVYHSDKGRVLISEKPAKEKKETPKSGKGRSDTSITFARYVNSIPEISNIWNNAKVKGTSPFNKLVKNNLKFIDYNLLTVYNIITPNISELNEIKLQPSEIIMNSKTLSIDFRIKSSKYIPEDGILCVVMGFQNPKKNNEEQLVLSHIIEKLSSVVSEAPIKLELQMNDAQKQMKDKYQNCIIYLAVIFNGPNLISDEYSATFAKSISCL